MFLATLQMTTRDEEGQPTGVETFTSEPFPDFLDYGHQLLALYGQAERDRGGFLVADFVSFHVEPVED